MERIETNYFQPDWLEIILTILGFIHTDWVGSFVWTRTGFFKQIGFYNDSLSQIGVKLFGQGEVFFLNIGLIMFMVQFPGLTVQRVESLSSKKKD